MLNIRSQFPFFIENPDLIYLDSAATSQKPQVVIDALSEFYSKYNSNAGRSSYPLANKLTKQVEHVREQVQHFINADHNQEIIFTSGATDSFNKVAYSLGFNYLQDGDEILYCPQDHKSFILPWFQVAKIKNVKLIPFGVRETGGIDIDELLSKVNSKTKVINVTHIHNVFGAESDIDQLRQKISNKEIIINFDATQSVGHRQVDVQKLGADILSFSGHKMFASQGIGVAYINKRVQSFIPSVFVGGGNGIKLENNKINITNFIQSYEAGTQNYAGVLTLGKAIEFIEEIGTKEIHNHLSELTQYLLEKLRTITGVTFTNGPYYWRCAGGNGILSFKTERLSSTELGFIFAEKDILVRTGDHCVSSHKDSDDTIRVSLHIYNTREDIDKFISVLKKIVN